jgi:hypothetical protein
MRTDDSQQTASYSLWRLQADLSHCSALFPMREPLILKYNEAIRTADEKTRQARETDWPD